MDAPVTQAANYFTELYRVNVKEHVEKKNGFSYVSWPFAVAELRKRHPNATWEVMRFDGLPYQSTPAGHFVEVAVTVNDVRLSQIHPVLDHANRPIKEPNAFHINTSIQRCLVKAIALHGLGLFVFAGEDLPEGSDAMGETKKVPSEALDSAVLEFRTAMALDVEEADKAEAVYAVHRRVNADEDLYKRVGEALNPAERRALHAYVAMHRKAMLDQPLTNGRARM